MFHTLFNLYSKVVIFKVLADLDCGIKVNKRVINNLQYADETVLMASLKLNLRIIVNRLNDCNLKAVLRKNAQKT